MQNRVEYFKCRVCNKMFETEDNEIHCPNCNSVNVMGVRAGRKFDIV